METRELETGARVLLRLAAREDDAELCALRRESWEHLAPWEPAPEPGVSPWGRAWFEAFLRGGRRENCLRALICATDGGAILGGVNLNEIVRGPFQSAYLGYWIGAPHVRKGYMREALELSLSHAFEALGLHRVEANIQPENAASLALVRGAGFAREGYSPRYLSIDGDWRDHERWALLVEDWRARRAR